MGTRLRTVHRASSSAIWAGGSGPPRNLVRRAVGNFHFFELKVYALADPQHAVGEVKGEGLSNLRDVCIGQDYVLFLRAAANRFRAS